MVRGGVPAATSLALKDGKMIGWCFWSLRLEDLFQFFLNLGTAVGRKNVDPSWLEGRGENICFFFRWSSWKPFVSFKCGEIKKLISYDDFIRILELKFLWLSQLCGVVIFWGSIFCFGFIFQFKWIPCLVTLKFVACTLKNLEVGIFPTQDVFFVSWQNFKLKRSEANLHGSRGFAQIEPSGGGRCYAILQVCCPGGFRRDATR